MRFFYIRHAPTRVSATGEMVENYDSYGIMPFDRDKWWKEVGCHLPDNFILLVSPIMRCIETAEVLFSGKEYKTLESLREFDCSKLGNKKFWEITEKEFNSIVNLTKREITDRIEDFLCDCLDYKGDAQIVVVGHGLYGRCIYDYYHGGKTGTPFEILNSKNFQFRNLDMMEVEKRQVQNIYRFTTN